MCVYVYIYLGYLSHQSGVLSTFSVTHFLTSAYPLKEIKSEPRKRTAFLLLLVTTCDQEKERNDLGNPGY